jgi:hypothetical protein
LLKISGGPHPWRPEGQHIACPSLKPFGSSGTKIILKEITQRYIVCDKFTLILFVDMFHGQFDCKPISEGSTITLIFSTC